MKNTQFLLGLFSACLLSQAVFADAAPKGLPNFHVVNDLVLRGGQPTDEGFRTLAAMGVKTIVDLQSDDRSKNEPAYVQSLGLRYINIPMTTMTTPSDQQISGALKALNDTADGPIFVHCKGGRDRTGTVIACYRIGHDGWDNQKALNEARGYGMGWYQFSMQKYVRAYEPLADTIRDTSAQIVEKASHGLTGLLDSVRK